MTNQPTDTTHVAASCPVCGAEDPTGLCCMTVNTDDAGTITGGLTRAFRGQGYTDVTCVLANPHGYAVTTPDRAVAFSLARAVLNSFEADPEAGLPGVAVKAPGTWRDQVGWVVRVTIGSR